MSVPRDLRADLQQISVPAVPLDDIVRRGRRLKLRKTLVSTFAALTAVAVVAVGITSLDWDRVAPDRASGPGPAASASDDADITVFLLDRITAHQRREIRSVARDIDGVVSVRYISKRAAYQDFVETYRDQPEYWENLPPNALPALFSIDLEDGTDVEEAGHHFYGLRGVDDVRWEPRG